MGGVITGRHLPGLVRVGRRHFPSGAEPDLKRRQPTSHRRAPIRTAQAATFGWTNYLVSKVSPEWKEQVSEGKAVKWPDKVRGWQGRRRRCRLDVRPASYAEGLRRLRRYTSPSRISWLRTRLRNKAKQSSYSSRNRDASRRRAAGTELERAWRQATGPHATSRALIRGVTARRSLPDPQVTETRRGSGAEAVWNSSGWAYQNEAVGP